MPLKTEINLPIEIGRKVHKNLILLFFVDMHFSFLCYKYVVYQL